MYEISYKLIFSKICLPHGVYKRIPGAALAPITMLPPMDSVEPIPNPAAK